MPSPAEGAAAAPHSDAVADVGPAAGQAPSAAALTAELRARLPRASAYLLALSGGADSAALAWLLRELPGLRCAHIDHGLGPQAAPLAQAAAAIAARCGLGLTTRRLRLDATAGNLEARAREARYAALGALLRPGEVLLCAQHQRDQAETFLLAAARRSGPAGLAGMPPLRPFARGWLARPALDTPAPALRAVAHAAGLPYVDDESNADPRHKRNALRLQVGPALRAWQGDIDAALAAVARQQGEVQAGLAAALDALLPAAAGPWPQSWRLAPLLGWPEALLQPALRRLIARAGAPPAPARVLAGLRGALGAAAADAQPQLSWQGWSLRRHAQWLFVVPPLPAPPPAGPARAGAWPSGGHIWLDPALAATLPAGSRLEAGPTQGSLPRADRPGLRLKAEFARRQVPPWLRSHWPQLRCAGRVLAVAEWPADGLQSPPALRWQAPPPWAQPWVEQARRQPFR